MIIAKRGIFVLWVLCNVPGCVSHSRRVFIRGIGCDGCLYDSQLTMAEAGVGVNWLVYLVGSRNTLS